MKAEQEICAAVIEAHDGVEACKCELPLGHQLSGKQGRPKSIPYSFKHRQGGVVWTDGGAERIKQENQNRKSN